MKFSELYKLLEKNGWEKRNGKKHAKYVHPNFKNFIPVGRHPGQEVPTGTLNKILKEAGLKS
jgi:predicted RNA binding protein YcfA (HicA-like mRNA interferase family)